MRSFAQQSLIYSVEFSAAQLLGSRALTRRLDADLVLTLDRQTEREAKALKLDAPVEMLGDYVGTGEEVEDPYGRSTRHYHEVAVQLKRLIELVVARLDVDSGALTGSTS